MPATTSVKPHESSSCKANQAIAAPDHPASRISSYLSRGVSWLSVVLPRLIPVEILDHHRFR